MTEEYQDGAGGAPGKVIVFILREPWFGSKLDECAFFGWLQAVPGVISVIGVQTGLRVTVDLSLFNDLSLKEMLSLYYRYELDFGELKIFINYKNSLWVCRPTMYWWDRLPVDIKTMRAD